MRQLLFSAILDEILFILAGNDDIHSSKLGQILSGSTELAALEHLKN